VSPNAGGMGVAATLTLRADAISDAQSFVWVFATIYSIVLLAYILSSWLRLPYSPWLNRIQRFLYDVSEPYLRIFRRVLPSMGPVDFSPMVGLIVLWVVAKVLMTVLGKFH
jgi:YggT family protein